MTPVASAACVLPDLMLTAHPRRGFVLAPKRMKANVFFQTKHNKMTSPLEETGAFPPPPTLYSGSFSQSGRERKSPVYTGL